MTLGATLLTLIFEWYSSPMKAGSISNGASEVRVYPYAALFFAILACAFSLNLVKSIAKTLKST